MKILAIADVIHPDIVKPDFPAFDMLISAGDIPNYFLHDTAQKLEHPPLFVLGNHVEGYHNEQDGGTGKPAQITGCINLHKKVIAQQGLLVAGLEGCGTYRPAPQHYSDGEFRRLARALSRKLLWHYFAQRKTLDILVTHAPPQGQNAGDTPSHRGIAAFNRLHKQWQPTLHLHGHVHLYGEQPNRSYQTQGVQVINVYGYVLLEWAKDGKVTILQTS